MGGGLMQLVAYGAQDIYLTGNPQISFFKVVYRRHTNFAIEAIAQVFQGDVDFGRKTSCTIARNGDLLHKIYIELDVELCAVNTVSVGAPTPVTNVARPGHSIIDFVEIEIGGQTIDKHYGEWMDLWTQMSSSPESYAKLERLVNGSLFSNNQPPDNGVAETDCRCEKLYIPLHFWFNKNPGLALPLIALQYHEVKLNLVLKSASHYKLGAIGLGQGAQVPGTDTTHTVVLKNICLFCDYIFLDTDERRRFAQVSHEYLIDQVQFNGRTPTTANVSNLVKNVKLNFNHPVKELVWLVQSSEVSNSEDYKYAPFFYGGTGTRSDILNKAVLQLNGHDRFREREGTYFRLVQPYQHHTGAFDHNSTSFDEKGFFYMYSFGLKPEEHQPSGSCNFSRIDSAVLVLDLNTSTGAAGSLETSSPTQIRVYATNYNVLRIMSGMGGLAYSN